MSDEKKNEELCEGKKALSIEELEKVSGSSIVDSLKKLQDGMKIDSSSDDSGGYQIGEEIREKIRQGINPYQ